MEADVKYQVLIRGLTQAWPLQDTAAAAAAAAAKSLQSCPTLCDPRDGSPPGSPVPGIDSPGKNTGVGCHFLLPCMTVKNEREVAQSPWKELKMLKMLQNLAIIGNKYFYYHLNI